jgi:hypothetical protein
MVEGVANPEVWHLKPPLYPIDQCLRWGAGILNNFKWLLVFLSHYHALLAQGADEVYEQCDRIDCGDFANGCRFGGIG